ncbi:MAG: bifunctional (p)ppGpp synthetase/guanosine-3',5'-bis(diphosphate) 3'-pyrophosphohydrolase [Actinomycetota bacterium]|nr:bifunctional (p)ppGpp synthetase/guanosine-3',5'-bis(diphosphate) 3'-pyrophosphohydrolase [Actinomycetota bacterium]
MPEEELEALVDKVKKYNPKADVALIRRAFARAHELHELQKRKSGEAYIAHPLGVADILADMEMDTTTIAAALLHDVIEDTNVSLFNIQQEFGNEVADLIDGVTKLGRIKFKTYAEEQAENLRKMLLAMAKDIRVILIKLADRLHNMRTICYLSPEKQREKAEETLEIYAPLAHRLGIFQLKWELEDLAFFTLEPKKYDQLQKMLAESREQREGFLKDVIKQIKKDIGKMGVTGQISGRTKHFYSIYQKMIKREKDLNEIYDLSAVRIIVDSVRDCYAVLGVVHSLWRPIPGRFKDYVAMPKFNMYQSLHTTVIGPTGKPFEIQIRTDAMHKTAEYGIAAHWRYKEGGAPGEGDRQFSWLREMVDWQTETKDPREFMESLKVDLFEDEVFVFTPKGDVINLRAGSTPLDFAYAIHTDVGHHCVGAKVNNQIVSLEYRLKVGDIVDVLTSKTSVGPSKDWLSIAKTSRARSKIRQWFSKESREDSEQLGRELIQKTLRKQGVNVAGAAQAEALGQVSKGMNFAKPETLMAAVGSGKISVKQVTAKIIKILNRSTEEVEPLLPTKLPPSFADRAKTTGVKVKGIDDLLIRLAHCCHPVPGDPIIGFVTRGRGLSIHRADCVNAQSLNAFPDRILEVAWDDKQPTTYQVEIQVEALDRTKLLSDISAVLSDSGVNILTATVSTRKDRIAVFRFVFEIGNLRNLNNIINTIKHIDAVFDAYRVLPNRTTRVT